MANTAIGAAGEDARTITFMNKEHKEFYLEYLSKCRWKDVYHKALVYCLGIDRDTRKHVNRIYDLKNGSVKPECLQEGWQTNGADLGERLHSVWSKLCYRFNGNKTEAIQR